MLIFEVVFRCTFTVKILSHSYPANLVRALNAQCTQPLHVSYIDLCSLKEDTPAHLRECAGNCRNHRLPGCVLIWSNRLKQTCLHLAVSAMVLTCLVKAWAGCFTSVTQHCPFKPFSWAEAEEKAPNCQIKAFRKQDNFFWRSSSTHILWETRG